MILGRIKEASEEAVVVFVVVVEGAVCSLRIVVA